MELLQETVTLLVRHWAPLTAYTLLWFALHGLVEFVVPALAPNCYDFLVKSHANNAAGAPLPPTLAMRRAAARDVRTKVVAVAMALWVCAMSVVALLQPQHHALLHRAYGSTPLTEHLTYLTTGYFVWDVVMCALDRLEIGFWVHGWACLVSFIWGMRPYQHYMVPVVLLFETSTIFMHWRRLLIQIGATSGLQFALVQAAFALTFFLVRLVFGGYQFWFQMQRILEIIGTGTAPNVHVCYAYMTMCGVLYTLNLYWMSQIVLAAVGGGGQKIKQKKLGDGKTVRGSLGSASL